MRQKLFLTVALCLACLFSARAQTVIESESNIVFGDNTMDVSIVIENPDRNFDGKIQLELLDAANKIRANTSQNLNLKQGRETYKISLPVGDLLKTAEDEIVWFRLHYRAGRAEGFISLSELIRDVFELRVAASENVFLGTNYRARVRAVQPFTNAPVKNVRIEGELTLEIDTEADEDEIKLKAKGETDGEGFAVLDFKIPENIKLDDIGDFKVTGRKNGIVREFENDDLEAPQKEGSLFLTADKPIYQPGQFFNVRALYFDVNSTVVADGELKFTVKDEEDTTLYRETVKTSAFGIASISWKIPDNAKLGGYRVEVEAEDDIYGNQMYFKVSRYDLPQFSVAARADKTFYLPNDKQAEITVRADYLFGKPVTGGKVRVVQESDRRWNWSKQRYDIEEKQAFEGATDAEGKFVAKVDLNGEFGDLQNSSWRRFEDLNFSAYFTDQTTNRTEQRRFDIRLTKEPIHIYLIRKYYDDLSPKLPVTAYVSTFYADGTPVVCDVVIEGKNDDDDNDSFKTLGRLKTNSLGAGKIEFPRPGGMDASDDLDLKITARDAKGQTGTFEEEISYYNDHEGIKIETEKTIFKPGEAVKIKIFSTRKNALVYLDIVQNWSVVESRFVKLNGDGRGEIKIPYHPNFKGELTVAAYFEEKEPDRDGDYDLIKDSRGVIFPEQQNLRLDAQFSAATYKPGEDAKVKFSVLDGIGKSVESALGVVVFDKAVEERAKTDAEFGSYFSRFRGWLGYEKSFGGITLKDLNELDPSKPVSPEMQLAAEVMLANSYYSPRIYRSGNWETNAQSVYAGFFKNQLGAIENALKKQFEKTYAHPTDETSLRKILSENGVDFDALRDPWGNNYAAVFTTEKAQNLVTLKTAGADKKRGTKDDFAVSSSGFAYFTPIGKAIDKAVTDYHKQTGSYIRDLQTLSAELAKQDIDLSKVKDRWNKDYRIAFEVAGRNYLIRFYSLGANGIYEPTYYNRDDFEIWKSAVDYFAKIDFAVNRIFSQTVNGGKRPFPKDDAEFKQILKENGLDLADVRDGYGQPVYVTFEKMSRYSDKTTVENGKQKITPVTEDVLTFRIRSSGENRYSGQDDFELTSFSGVLSEESKDAKFETKGVKTIAYSGANGAIRGTVTDATGAVVANASVFATKVEDSAFSRSTVTLDDGTFLLENLPSGFYNVRVEAAGFKLTVFSNIEVRSQNLVEITASLEAGASQETVTVQGDSSVTIDSSDTKIDTNISKQAVNSLPKQKQAALAQMQATSTPRLREYFPETLFWAPEIITDKNGRAELKFKMADNITTWKLYTVASTKNGKIGVTEKEITAFQPFFVDLDPPKFLTDGDEIFLPAQVRNYTTAKQKVGVTMAKSDWFSFLNAETRTLESAQTDSTQNIEVASNASGNAVFGFRANAVVKDGKQKVTALAANDSDAIEKPVTVRPNGQEIVRTESKLFSNSAAFDVNFPENALPQTPKAELKIYPNLMAHVTESVEGLLQRPYGCGEQTISSTYPNLMILKFSKGDGKTFLEQKAQKFLQKGYERLLGYQVGDGGFSYWGGKDSSDIALTAYALRFLADAKEFIEVDAKAVENAQNYLIKQQRADGSFTKKYYGETVEDAKRTKLFTSYVARTLAMLKTEKSVLDKALGYLKTRGAEIDEPYALALYGLASMDAGNTETAREIAGKLGKMALTEGDRVYWNLETNTPFYGWGTAGRIETTALVLQLLIKVSREAAKPQSEAAGLISKATMFLLKSKDRYGVWYSTQTTINVLDAFLASLAPGKDQTISILVNGEKLKDIAVSADRIEPVILDLTGKLANANRVEITGSDNSQIMSQVVSTHYIDWKDADVSNRNVNDSRAVRLDYKCDKSAAKIMETVSCAVETERVGFKGYGMLLAEIGLPPGADVSRESLEKAFENDWSLSRYDVLPDRIVVYMWAKAGGTKFNFSFKPRYGINANTPASIVYDYYNEEAKGTVAPLRFEVK